MKKFIVILMLSVFVSYSSVCLAGSHKGSEKMDKDIKGFSQGEKSGWDGDYPNGWDKMSKEEKKEWMEKHGKDSEDMQKAKKKENEMKEKKDKEMKKSKEKKE